MTLSNEPLFVARNALGSILVEQITTAIIAALVSGINSIGGEAVKDAYSALKNKLVDVFSSDNNNNAVDALEKLEEKPESTARQELLKEEFEEVNLEQQPEHQEDLLQLVNALLQKMDETDVGRTALSKYNIQAQKIGIAGDNATVTNLNL